MPQADPATPLVTAVTLRMDSTRDTAGVILPLGRAYAGENAHIAILTEIEDREAWLATPEERRGLFITYHYPLASDLWAVPIARDGLVLVVHHEARVNALSLDDVRAIYQGTLTSWAQLGGGDVPIVPIVRPVQADLQDEFRRLVMGQRRITPNARLANSSEQAYEILSEEAGAIGFLTWSQLQRWVAEGTLLTLVSLEGIAPSKATLSDNTYALPLTIFALSSERPTDFYEAFLLWVQGEAGQKVLKRHYLPLE